MKRTLLTTVLFGCVIGIILGCGGGGGGGGGSTPLNSTVSGYVFVPEGAAKQSKTSPKKINAPAGMVPLVGAKVQFSDGSRSTTTNSDGYYSLRVFVSAGSGENKTVEVWMDDTGNEKITFETKAEIDKYSVSKLEIQGSVGNWKIKEIITPPPTTTETEIETQITTIIGETLEFAGLTSAIDLRTGGQVQLSWEAPSHSDSPFSYRIYLATDSASQDFTANPYTTVINGLSTVLSGLGKTTYYIVVCAITNSGKTEDIPNQIEKVVTVTLNNAPQISLTSPNGGEALSGVENIIWNASDEDEDTLLIDIYYSVNGGDTWDSIASDVNNSGSYPWDTTTLGDGLNYKVKVIADDGLTTNTTISHSNFSIGNGVVVITDQNLESAMRQAVFKATGDILKSDLAGLTDFTASDLSITDISGLEHCTNLTGLTLQDNEISNLSPIQNLTALVRLDLENNQITDIGALQNLINLEYLDLYINQITDISPVSSLTSLEHLYLAENSFSDISHIQSLTSLTSLNLNSVQISDVSVLQNLYSLERLYLKNTQVSDVNVLQSLDLKELVISDTQVQDISFLQHFPNMQELELAGLQISDVSILQNLNNLHYLDLSNNQISDIVALVNNYGLTRGHRRKRNITHVKEFSSLATTLSF